MIPRIEKLQPRHAVDSFDCGNQDLNRFLQQYALQNQSSGASSTYVGLADQAVIGYYSLAVGSVEYGQAPERVTKGLAHHPIPVMLLARLAVDQQWQNKGVGAGLLKDAMLRTLQAADIVGIRALLVHAKDTHATGFYQHFDFISSPSDPLHLLILLKDMRKIVA
ncbi:MAG: GNAT family N-acetyltransferase [Nitrospirota bacterium]|nr:GNAT family N-acetyltransferase [Nitrospirota bacterium]MDP2382493.1 GNAT family N-acetyltransferase [Nitrospirota bacterium]MDP3596943.1 GNAT family N-acetyltransferase [Nitrospirota bacterium]